MFRAVFLDRDGTIAEDVNYCSREEDFHVLPTVPEAVKLLNENNFKVIVITNQSGIARGYFSVEILDRIHEKMRSVLAEHSAKIDAIYYCPHHPDEGCDCRKPKPGLLLRAAHDLNINLGMSYMIGDAQKDIDAGRAAGCRPILVTTGPNGGSGVTNAYHISKGLLTAAEFIIRDSAM